MLRVRSEFRMNGRKREQLVLVSFVSWPLWLITHCADLSGVEENPISHCRSTYIYSHSDIPLIVVVHILS